MSSIVPGVADGSIESPRERRADLHIMRLLPRMHREVDRMPRSALISAACCISFHTPDDSRTAAPPFW